MPTTPDPGIAVELEPGIRRVLAPNPSPMTHHGTNTYLVGAGRVAVIDPGPDDPAHFSALLGAIGGARVSHILVTHAHRDHSTLAPRLARETRAPVVAFGAASAGRSPVMERLAATGAAGGGEGVDTAFRPDDILSDGEALAAEGWTIEAIHTPGHFAGHLSFAVGDAVFTGDHVMGWASTLISPPDGDLTAFMASCTRLAGRKDRVYYPGHGTEISAPADRLNWLITHRRERERQIVFRLAAAPGTAAEIARDIYTDIPPALMPAAARNVLAHLIDLAGRGLATTDSGLTETARFRHR